MRMAAAATILLTIILLAAAGCDSGTSGGSVSELEGKSCTVEYRPIRTNETEALHKQRQGKLLKVTADWVALKEGANEIWIPRDMVLEIRLDPK